MKIADNWERVFVVVRSLGFEDDQIIGGISPNLIAFAFLLE